MVKLLIEKGADPNIPDSDGQSAKDYAKMSGHLEVVRSKTHSIIWDIVIPTLLYHFKSPS